MKLRHDAGFAAASVATFVRRMANDMGGTQVATVGKIDLTPNLVNVIPKKALMTVDLRNTREERLLEAEKRLEVYLDRLSRDEGVEIARLSLARFEPVGFDAEVVERVVATAEAFDLTVKRMPSGAGHDAQAFAPNCPTGMIFVPSVEGISHNVREHTDPADIERGANVLLQVMLQLAQEEA
jgi:N-carbamoyl-L-amino-acid hydrolase